MIEVKSKDCPDRDSLQLLLLGKTTGVDAEDLEAHLLQCDECAAAAEAISLHDDLTDAFRNHRLIEEEADIVNEVIERARRLQSKEETSCVEETVVISSAEPGATSGLPSRATQPNAGKSTLPEVDEALLDCLAPPETPGEIGRLANYRVLEVLGSGGMGIVFLAEDLQLKRQVALKVMQPIAAADREARDRFLREARATAAIEHDHIVSIYQVGEDRGVPFIAMRYIRGESLQTRLEREGRLDQREALRIGRELADGLAAAHQRGLIHRDIKPANVWLEQKSPLPPGEGGERGKPGEGRTSGDARPREQQPSPQPSPIGRGSLDRVKIVDFGLVRAVADDAELTKSGVILGTPRYMSPEQAQGEKVDQRCDLFSLGSLLYRLVAGKTAFTGTNTTSALIAVAKHDPEPLEDLAPGLHPDFAALIMQLLQKNPDDRPNSAAEVSNRIADIERQLDAAFIPKDATGDTLLAPSETYRLAATQQTASAGRRRHSSKAFRWIAAATLLTGFTVAVLYFSGVIFRIKTPDGTLVIEVDDPKNVVVEIDGQKVKVKLTPDGKAIEISIEPGTRKLVVKTAEGTILKTDGDQKIEISAGKTWKIKAWLEKKAVAKGKGAKPKVAKWQLTSEQQQFFDAVAKLKAEKQIEAVRERLKLVNPGFDGKLEHRFEGGEVTLLALNSPGVGDLWPIAALRGLRRLDCSGTAVERLSLIGRFGDLVSLDCSDTTVRDLTPLARLTRLERLDCSNTSVFDLTPLHGLPLTELKSPPLTAYNERALAVVNSLKRLKTFNGLAPADWLERRCQLEGQLEELRATAAAFSAQKQLERIVALLKAFNPGFDGKLEHKIENGRVVELRFITDQVTDISPVRALSDLNRLICNGSAGGKGRLADLSPLQGMPLTSLICNFTRVADLSPLQGLPLTFLECHSTRVTDLSPLQELPLTNLNCAHTQVADLSPLQGLPLTNLNCYNTPVADLSPLQGMKLTSLDCGGTRVADLSPLQGMPLTELSCYQTRVVDLSPLQGMPLTSLNCVSTRVADLSPLQGMPLTSLSCFQTRVADLSPLQGMPLTTLICFNTRVADLSPLQGLRLENLWCDVRLYHPADETLLKSLPLKKLNGPHLGWTGMAAEDFWKQLAARRKAAEEFVESAAKLPAEKQIEAVRARFKELDPKYSGTLGTKVAGETVTEATFGHSNPPHDLTPLMAFKGLKKLTITRGPDWLDLSPLKFLPLETLTCPEPMTRKNAPVLAEIKTLKTINGQPAAAFWKQNAAGIH